MIHERTGHARDEAVVQGVVRHKVHGPGTRPSKVHASNVTPSAIAIFAWLIVIRTRRSV